LRGHVRHDAGRHIRRISQERAQESGGDDLQCHAETVVIAAPLRQEFTVGVVEVKIASKLSRGRLASIATVAPLLFVGQEIDRHGRAC
jgi:hypothetical protein